jgi:sortase A
MQRISIGSLILIVSLCATYVLLSVFMPRPVDNPVPVAAKAPETRDDSAEVPVKVSVPSQMNIEKIKVNAAIRPVGLTAAGDMDIGENPTELAWYQYGPKPGETGSAVVAGHYGWKGDVPSVFNDLNTLAKGDKITVQDQNGKESIFAVTKIALYDPDQDATEVFRSNDGKAHLNLITCQGSWVNAKQSYTKRLVIFTDLENGAETK